jgi:hypothetical protein
MPYNSGYRAAHPCECTVAHLSEVGLLSKTTEYKLSADRFRDLAAREFEPQMREQFLILAGDYDFLAATEEKLERDKAHLP